jgi:hypothetical protein
MAEDGDADAAAEGTGPAGPFLREYTPPTGTPTPVSAQRATVAFYRNGGHSVITTSEARHVDKPVLARPHTVCEIALDTHVTTIRVELPAVDGTTFFKAQVEIQWTVTDPYLVALGVVTDVGGRLTAPVVERLREITSAYTTTEGERAGRAITRACASGSLYDLGAELGLRVRLDVRLETADRAVEPRDDALQATYAQVSDVLRFRLKAPAPGLHQVTVRAFRGGTFLGEVTCQISVAHGSVTVDGAQRHAPLPSMAFDPGEVTLQVLKDEAAGTFSFQLIGETCYAPEIFHFRAGDPRQATEQIYSPC